MPLPAEKSRSKAATLVFELLNPLPFGFFAAALVFDAIYTSSPSIMWVKAAAWLITFGLLLAIIPRLINLVQVWVTGPRPRPFAATLSFWLNLVAILAAITNAFVHSRDAYGTMPDGLWLSIVTVLLLAVANLAVTSHRFVSREQR